MQFFGNIKHIFNILDAVANTVYGTVDATKNVAASAVDKTSSLVGAAKGIFICYLCFCFVSYFS